MHHGEQLSPILMGIVVQHPCRGPESALTLKHLIIELLSGIVDGQRSRPSTECRRIGNARDCGSLSARSIELPCLDFLQQNEAGAP